MKDNYFRDEDPAKSDPYPENDYISRLSDHLTEPDDDYREAQRLKRVDPELFHPMTRDEIEAAQYEVEQREKHNAEVEDWVQHYKKVFKNHHKIKGYNCD